MATFGLEKIGSRFCHRRCVVLCVLRYTYWLGEQSWSKRRNTFFFLVYRGFWSLRSSLISGSIFWRVKASSDPKQTGFGVGGRSVKPVKPRSPIASEHAPVVIRTKHGLKEIGDYVGFGVYRGF